MAKQIEVANIRPTPNLGSVTDSDWSLRNRGRKRNGNQMAAERQPSDSSKVAKRQPSDSSKVAKRQPSDSSKVAKQQSKRDREYFQPNKLIKNIVNKWVETYGSRAKSQKINDAIEFYEINR